MSNENPQIIVVTEERKKRRGALPVSYTHLTLPTKA